MLYGAASAGPPLNPMEGGSKGFPSPCGVGVVCGIVVVYRFFPPCHVGVVYSIVVVYIVYTVYIQSVCMYII